MNPLTWTFPEWMGALALLVSIIGAIVQILKLRGEVDEKSASTAKLLAEATETLLSPLSSKVEELDKKVKQLSSENDNLKGIVTKLQTAVIELSAGVEILSNQIISLGHKPKWTKK